MVKKINCCKVFFNDIKRNHFGEKDKLLQGFFFNDIKRNHFGEKDKLLQGLTTNINKKKRV